MLQPSQLGRGLDESVIRYVGAQPLQESVSEFQPGLLATTEHDGDLDLRPCFEEADHVALVRLVIVRVDLRPKLLFLDDGLLLVLAGLTRLLRRLV